MTCKLCLPPVVFHAACRVGGDRVPVLPLNDMQRHIDTGRDTGRRHEIPFVYDPLVVECNDLWKLVAHVADRCPMGRRRFAVEQTGFGEQERPRANAGGQHFVFMLSRDPVDDSRIVDLAPGPVTTRNHDHV